MRLPRVNRFNGAWGRMVVRGLVIAAATAVPLVLPAAPAYAQPRVRMNAGGGFGMSSGITSRELDRFSTILGLSDEQKQAMKTLHESYLADRSVETKALDELRKNAQNDFMETQDTSVFKDLAEKSKQSQDKIDKIDSSFMDDLKALLDGKQADKWPAVERQHRRDKLMTGMGPMGLAGENVNLISIVDDLQLSDRSTELKEAIEQYELALDRALVTRRDKQMELQKQSEEQMKDFDPSKFDFSAIRRMMTEMRKSGIPVREANERHTRVIASLLPADKKADFEDRVRKGTFTQVYRETYTSKALTAAMGFSDLTDEQKSELSRFKETYSRDLAAANERWATAITDEEKEGGGDPFGGFGAFVPGGGSSDKPSPVQEAKKARTEMEKTSIQRLKDILSPAQVERLPEREMENPFANFGGGGGSDADEGTKERAPAGGRRGR